MALFEGCVLECGDSFSPELILSDGTKRGFSLIEMAQEDAIYLTPFLRFNPNSNGSIQNAMVMDMPLMNLTIQGNGTNCCTVSRAEQTSKAYNRGTLKSEVTASNTLLFSKFREETKFLLETTPGMYVGRQLLIVTPDGTRYYPKITAVDANGIQFNGAALTLPIGSDIVLGGYDAISIKDCTPISEAYCDRFGHDTRHTVCTKLVSVPFCMSFDKCDLQKPIRDVVEANDIATARAKWINEYITKPKMEQFLKDVFQLMWRNDDKDTMSMLGTIEQLEIKRQAELAKADGYYLHNFSNCCTTAPTNCEIVRSFTNTILKPLSLFKYSKQKNFIALCNREQLEVLNRLRVDFYNEYEIPDGYSRVFNYSSQDLMAGNPLEYIFKNKTFKKIEYMGVTLEFQETRMFEILGEPSYTNDRYRKIPQMYIYPKDYIGIGQISEDFEINGNNEIAASVRSGYPTIYVTDAGSTRKAEEAASIYCPLSLNGRFYFYMWMKHVDTGTDAVGYHYVYGLSDKKGCEDQTSCATTLNTGVFVTKPC